MKLLSLIMTTLVLVLSFTNCSSQLDYDQLINSQKDTGSEDPKAPDQPSPPVSQDPGPDPGNAILIDPSRGDTYLAINVGGQEFESSDGFIYQADAHYNGGKAYSTKVSIDKTQDDLLYQSERLGNFNYRLPVANGSYQLVLQFAEIFWTEIGKRQFEFAISDAVVETDFDMLKFSPPFEAISYVVNVEVTDGFLDLDFRSKVDAGKLSAIFLSVPGSPLPTDASSGSNILTPDSNSLLVLSRGDKYLAVNAGGSEVTSSDGFLYRADMGYIGGKTHSTTMEILETTNDLIYQTERHGKFSYHIPVDNGPYQVTIQVAEIYQTNIGERQFAFSIEDNQLAYDFDILKIANPFEPRSFTFDVVISDGQLDLEFFSEMHEAKLSGFVISVPDHPVPEL